MKCDHMCTGRLRLWASFPTYACGRHVASTRGCIIGYRQHHDGIAQASHTSPLPQVPSQQWPSQTVVEVEGPATDVRA